MGPLTWDDFTLSDSSRGDEHSYLEFFFSIEDLSDGQGVPSLVASAYMDTRLSWVDRNWRTDNELLYNQVVFDLVELQRRRMQIALNTLAEGSNEPLADSIVARVIADIDRLDNATRHGSDSIALRQWADSLRTVLDSMPSYASPLPQRTPVDDPYRIGGFLNLGFVSPTGALYHHFSHGIGMEMAIENGWRRHFLTTGLILGGASCRNDALSTKSIEDDLYKDDALTILSMYLQYGYAIFDNDRYRISPFVGYGFLGYYYTTDDEAETSIGPTAGCASFGIDCKVHLANSVIGSDRNVLSVNTRLYCTYSNFSSVEGSPAGFTVNLSLGISLLTGTVYYQ